MARLALAAVAVILTSGCQLVAGNGRLTSEDRTVPQFSRIEVHSAVELTATPGPQAVMITTDSNLQQYLETFVQGDTLFIQLRPGVTLSWPATLRASVSSPRLEGISAHGASDVLITATPVPGTFVAGASGASTVTVTSINAGAVRTFASGASHVDLAGTAASLDVDASGASHLDAAGLPVARATLDVSGASFARVRASEQVDGFASGASTVEIRRGPATRVDVSASGSSTVRQVN